MVRGVLRNRQLAEATVEQHSLKRPDSAARFHP
jgi:hypothetical protein